MQGIVVAELIDPCWQCCDYTSSNVYLSVFAVGERCDGECHWSGQWLSAVVRTTAALLLPAETTDLDLIHGDHMLTLFTHS